MATDGETTGDHVLDAREIDGEPFGEIMSALETIEGDESLLLINSFEPEPLYGVLSARGFDYKTTQEGDEEYHIEIVRG